MKKQYNIKIVYQDGSEDWVANLFMNGKIHTTKERKHALICSREGATHLVEEFIVPEGSFKRVPVEEQTAEQ